MAITFDKFTTYGNTQIFGADKSNLFVIGFDNANNNEFKYSLANFFPSVSSAGGTSLFKDITSDTQINLKGIAVGSNKLSVTGNTNDVTLDVNEANLTLNNIGGTLGLAKGGTGVGLTAPSEDSIMFYDQDAGQMAWLSVSQVNSGLNISGTNMSVVEQLTTIASKGDLITRTASAETALAVGANGYILKANDTTATGLEWANIADFQFSDLVYNDNFLGDGSSTGKLRVGSGISWSKTPANVTIAVDETQIDLSSCDNTTSLFRAITAHPDTSNITKSHHIEIVIGGDTYQLAGELVP